MFKVNIKTLLIIVVALSIVISYNHRENFVERETPLSSDVTAAIKTLKNVLINEDNKIKKIIDKLSGGVKGSTTVVKAEKEEEEEEEEDNDTGS
jgi:uncharacterized protein (UPF0333 family)